MRHTTIFLFLAGLLAAPHAMTQTPNPESAVITSAATAAATPVDPYLWLEDVQGPRALAWVQERNRDSEAALTGGERSAAFEQRRRLIREVLDSKEQIPYVSRKGAWFYNLWRDAANPRGLWRRTTLAEYQKPNPAWETVLDIDALGKAEKENWVWAGATCLGPSYTRCLLQLSRGGADASVTREFDTVKKTFVAAADGGFVLPEAKASVEWVNESTVFVATDFGAGSLTSSGYPRVVKRWQRGQPLAQATAVFEGQVKDVAVSVGVDLSPGFERTVFTRAVTFYTNQQFILQGDKAVQLAKPDDAQVSFWREYVLVQLRSDWVVSSGDKKATWPRGALLVANAAAYLKGQAVFTALFTPTATRSLEAFAPTRSAVLLTVLDNVAGRIEEWSPPAQASNSSNAWQMRTVKAPYPGQLSATPLHDPLLDLQDKPDPLGDSYLLNAADFLQPDSLQLGRTGTDERTVLKSRPTFYDATGMRVEQRFARSKDGTRVPYFVVWPKGAQADGKNPTLLYGYGGFEVSLAPWYSGSMGRVWATQGGAYVVANIRGGGEFGPGWHQAAVLKDKQNSYDDFAAVAEDLINTRVTSAAHLGIQGGSNGGLLVGAVMLQRPELFNAVVCQVPLLDMQRYHKLLAGASWMAEYGDPDQPSDWAFVQRYSPYQNVPNTAKGTQLPKVLFTTSTRDDRVHPGHARKMAARMTELGHALLYWENTEGGHGGAADNGQRAHMVALEYSFLWQQLAKR
jgi:prolyl oligopeptidase